MAFIELRDIEKSFGKNQVVKRLSLDVGKGEFVSFLGGSGCGKTTTLRMIAGFETPSAGSVKVDGRDMSGIAPNKRNLGMVFQNYALFPNMTVRRNIGFGLRIAGAKGAEVESRVDEMLGLIHMEEFAHRYPHQLSGGQQQRVALARAIAVRPSALLLDEPLSALDAKIRVKLRDDIRAIQQRLGITTIYVTHDQEEALSISDRVAVMREGRIEQIGSPFEVYNRPATPYVASFIGTLNLLSGAVADPSKGTLLVAGRELRSSGPIEAPAGAEVKLSLRPESLSIGAGQAGHNRIEGRIESVKFLGSVVRVVVETGGQRVFMDTFNDPSAPPPPVGSSVELSFPPEALKAGAAEAASEPERAAAAEEG
ncbi:MAG TPA: ABC transporter ATP-binding protein [Spirochaetales bacterium]|nr:ABC transporter ATP-binding protein [Spirochaetales bacterium]HRY53755.1 ABC transporter ATP-binding protein [Spirochaetia bacterium]HRZ63672.1 ABC transporter ATP-binding protein [Spirochaetia bacterium]